MTGKDIGENLQAMIFGSDDQPKNGAPVPADMADAGGESGDATVQTATREIRYAQSGASQLHEDCRG